MLKKRITALLILILGALAGYFVYASEITTNADSWLTSKKFRLGLDLSGGTHLVYRADVSLVEKGEIENSMNALRDIVERRVNLFGVSEPNVQIQKGGALATDDHRLIVDLPGVTDVSKAIEMIGQTPLLEFKTERPEGKEKEELVKKYNDAVEKSQKGEVVTDVIDDPYYVDSPLTGRYLKRARLEFDPQTSSPIVSIQFNEEGSELFARLTKENIGKTIAIYLDGYPISTPNVQQEITGGNAVITGQFTPQEAKTLVGRLNSGALPVPVELVSTQTIGPSLGGRAVDAGVTASMIGFGVIAVFLLLWYRLPGFVGILALGMYVAIMLTLIKLIPVTLTASGIAGFIISIGIAVDANVLIFERIKEEMKKGSLVRDAIQKGFDKAWASIRDSNISSLLTATILFSFGTTLIQGFALMLGMGVLVSLFSAIMVTRIFLFALDVSDTSKVVKFLFSSGLSK
jgi:protein-export membrane protein SecD